MLLGLGDPRSVLRSGAVLVADRRRIILMLHYLVLVILVVYMVRCRLDGRPIPVMQLFVLIGCRPLWPLVALLVTSMYIRKAMLPLRPQDSWSWSLG